MKLLEKFAEDCMLHKEDTNYEENQPIGSNDLKKMKQEVINEIGDMLQLLLQCEEKDEVTSDKSYGKGWGE